MLTRQCCLERQERFRKTLDERKLDAAILTDFRDVYYFTGMLLPEPFPVFLFLETGGGSWLVATTDEDAGCVDECLTFEWNEMGTNHFDPICRIDAVVADRLAAAKPLRKLGWQTESMPHRLAETVKRVLSPQEWVAVDDALRAQQRCKEPDELELIRGSIAADLGAYDAAQAAIAPGVTELEVLSAGRRGAMMTAGEKVLHDGDYRSGAPGGPARNRAIETGEIYIIDAWTTRRGYCSDLSRAFIVGAEPTDLQQSLFDHVAAVQKRVSDMLKPGLHTSELWQAMDQWIREHPALADAGLVHHGGHGVGLRAHEEPDINPQRGARLEPGHVISVEPGGYPPAARGGVRIENMYVITEDGAENLSEYPVELRCRGARE